MGRLQEFRSLGDHLRGLNTQQKLNVIPVAPLDIVADADAVVALEDNPKHSIRIIKNVGINPVKIMINTPATVEMYCDIIAGGDAEDDGKGGSFDASAFQGAVYVFAEDTAKIAIFKASEHENPAI